MLAACASRTLPGSFNPASPARLVAMETHLALDLLPPLEWSRIALLPMSWDSTGSAGSADLRSCLISRVCTGTCKPYWILDTGYWILDTGPFHYSHVLFQQCFLLCFVPNASSYVALSWLRYSAHDTGLRAGSRARAHRNGRLGLALQVNTAQGGDVQPCANTARRESFRLPSKQEHKHIDLIATCYLTSYERPRLDHLSYTNS